MTLLDVEPLPAGVIESDGCVALVEAALRAALQDADASAGDLRMRDRVLECGVEHRFSSTHQTESHPLPARRMLGSCPERPAQTCPKRRPLLMPKRKPSAASTATSLATIPLELIQSRITVIRGRRVMFDADLAAFYDVPTSRFNEAVKRHADRFPQEDFRFQLAGEEAEVWQRSRSQSAVLKRGQKIDLHAPPMPCRARRPADSPDVRP